MELREIISFYHVARLHSVSKAARRLELGQPTVTTHLRKLEDEFGITLFDRIKRPIQLTSEGSIFLELITPIVESVDTLKTQMDYTERRGSLHIGAYPDVVTHHLPKPIQSYLDYYPDVRLQLTARPYTTLIQLVKSGELDLAITAPPPIDEPSLEFFKLFDYRIVLLTPPGHQLLQKHPLDLHDIAHWPLILSSPDSITRHNLEQAFKDNGIRFDVVLAVDHAEAVKQYVEIGMGVAVGNDFTLHPDDQDKLVWSPWSTCSRRPSSAYARCGASSWDAPYETSWIHWSSTSAISTSTWKNGKRRQPSPRSGLTAWSRPAARLSVRVPPFPPVWTPANNVQGY